MSGSIRSYRDLDAWKLSVGLCTTIYDVTNGFPDSERYGLVNQLRRAVVSIPSNIAEGWGRGTSVEYARFLRVARGSLYEVETQLVIANELGYLGRETFADVLEAANQCGRVLAGLVKSIEGKSGRRSGSPSP